VTIRAGGSIVWGDSTASGDVSGAVSISARVVSSNPTSPFFRYRISSAESVLLALQSAGLPVGDYVVYTAETDLNGLLGRPGQYTAKVNFIDTSIGSGSSEFDIAGGGSIEVFEAVEQAEVRAEYLTEIVMANPAFVEYDFFNGSILLRVSGTLTPDEAARYDAALQEIVSC